MGGLLCFPHRGEVSVESKPFLWIVGTISLMLLGTPLLPLPGSQPYVVPTPVQGLTFPLDKTPSIGTIPLTAHLAAWSKPGPASTLAIPVVIIQR